MKASTVLITLNTSEGLCLRIFHNGHVILEHPSRELYQCSHLLEHYHSDQVQRLLIDLYSYQEYPDGPVQILYSIERKRLLRSYQGIPDVLFNMINILSSSPRIPSLHAYDQDGRIIIYRTDIIHYYSPILHIDEISEIDYNMVIQSLINDRREVDRLVEMIVSRMKILY